MGPALEPGSAISEMMIATEYSATTITSTARNLRRSSTRSVARPASTYQTPMTLQASPNALQIQRNCGAPVDNPSIPIVTSDSHASACHHDGLKSSSNRDAANSQKTTGFPM